MYKVLGSAPSCNIYAYCSYDDSLTIERSDCFPSAYAGMLGSFMKTLDMLDISAFADNALLISVALLVSDFVQYYVSSMKFDNATEIASCAESVLKLNIS